MLKDMLLTKALMGSSGGGGGSSVFIVNIDNATGILDKTYAEIASAAKNSVVICCSEYKDAGEEYIEIRYMSTIGFYTEGSATVYTVNFFNRDGFILCTTDSEDGYPKYSADL